VTTLTRKPAVSELPSNQDFTLVVIHVSLVRVMAELGEAISSSL